MAALSVSSTVIALPKLNSRYSAITFGGKFFPQTFFHGGYRFPVQSMSLQRPSIVIPKLKRSTRMRVEANWLDNSARVKVDVPIDVAWKLWEDRELIPNWMPWIDSVKVQPDKPELSRWLLRWEAFGQSLEFSWMAKSLQPLHHQKIHWKSVDGLPNRGAVRFYPKSSSSCEIELTISYEVPDILVPVAASLGPLVEQIIQGDLNRFAEYAKSQATV